MKTLLVTAALLSGALPMAASAGAPASDAGPELICKGGQKVHVKGKSSVHTTHRVTRLDRNGNGILDSRERRADRNRYGVNNCPPGLARKNNGCLPPGQARKLFTQGQRIPVAYRTRVPFNDGYRYIYRDNVVYVVDPATRLVTSVIDLLL